VSVVDGGIRVERSVRSSVLRQTFRMRAGVAEVEIRTDVDWHEHEKLLKLAFPVAVHADRAASEIQFGHVNRPTHANTSWDAARFETVAHRWVHVGEPGFGVVVANDATYGHDITRTVADDGSVVTLVRQSLLRGPRFPDPEADQGPHTFTSVLGVAPAVREALEVGYRVNLPVRTVEGSQAVEPLVTVDNPAVVVEAVKLAEDRSGDLIVRLYEALGGRATATVRVAVPWAEAWTTDLLERVDLVKSWAEDDDVHLNLKAFEIVTLRFGSR
jgi:alpha-mannosidase